MTYLGLAILCSTGIFLWLRITESKIHNRMAMFLMNYLVCLAFARYFVGRVSIITFQTGALTAVGLGALTGILYLTNFALLQWNIANNSMVLSSTFSRLGVLVPTLISILLFHDKPTPFRIAGLVLVVLAILLIRLDSGEGEERKRLPGLMILGLFALLLTNGLSDSMANIYDHLGTVELRNHYLFYLFASAAVLSLIFAVSCGKRVRVWDVVIGLILGFPNYFSARFLLLALQEVPGVLVYPAYSAGTLFLICFTGALFFREKMTKRLAFVMLLIVTALALLNAAS